MNSKDKKTTINRINEIIKQRIEEYYLSSGLFHVKGIQLEKTIERPFSTVSFWQIDLKGYSTKIVSKKINHHAINETITRSKNQAIVEFEILKKIYPLFLEIDQCSVPEPIFVEPEIETYAMAYIPGELLVDQFRFCRYLSRADDIKKLSDYYYNCGKWLKNFQRFTGLQKGYAEKHFEGVIERLNHRLGLICKKKDPRIPVGFAATVQKNIEDSIKLLKKQKITVSGRHGDFIPLNMIVNEKGICVIDFLGFGVEPSAVDVFKLLVCFHDEMLSVTSNPKTVRLMQTSFLQGYDSRPNESPSLLYICEAMQRMVSLWGNISSIGGLIHHKMSRNRCIKSHLKWFSRGTNAPLLWK